MDPQTEKTVTDLVEIFGFSRERSEEAVAQIADKTNVQVAYNWLLDHGEEDRGGPVTVVECSHLKECETTLAPLSSLKFDVPCALCSNTGENWVCLFCGEVGCSRYANSHAKQHFEAKNEHFLSLGYSDLSIWCYQCQAYVTHSSLTARVRHFQSLKFGFKKEEIKEDEDEVVEDGDIIPSPFSPQLSSSDVFSEVSNYLSRVLRKSPLSKITVETKPEYQSTGLFDAMDPKAKDSILSLVQLPGQEGTVIRRAVGSMVGMAVADSNGHFFEFLPVRDWKKGSKVPSTEPYFEYPAASNSRGVFHNPFNTFMLQPGQWTDDASMGLCMADSLLSCGTYDGSNMRKWFWNWWLNGLDNAFRDDAPRKLRAFPGRSLSVGLGGNISKSISEVGAFSSRGLPVPPRCTLKNNDAGNGSIMRLAPVPVRYHNDIAKARQIASESSYTTHPGPLAAEACAFLAHLTVRCMKREGDEASMTSAQFLDLVVEEYLKLLPQPGLGGEDNVAKDTIRRMLAGKEAESSTERCWNWRDENLGLQTTLSNRGWRYNGYPVSAEYFGSFSIDGLAMALHAFYHERSFNDTLVKIINMCGDADSTGSVCGQIAGAFYSVSEIESAWIQDMRKWDRREIELRGVCLYVAGSLD
mmetsp:Transcript_36668/g.50454  ORF Transcript_36668/g.50454 Transcript_36668/m.50454 type:complete len:639 (-) Transcript_36668:145-2061(-)|eukprot:CAMPEP_0201483908 /NCGR_PEP_ID=MMETSP0151_2-20130828/8101_1 /ASSEMBLY_ACC=CAM_ASM_000257 /TAXON_ID=200890 /ORGANISM="Paramoeba atlantica, Strain 621/1 / CCAP 1560/9" /LENGTH=638 /DNA_ID=CAMNT_0047867281 /DNA_START=61 /DNA_END=1977 /DNA_ORIENTATION=+